MPRVIAERNHAVDDVAVAPMLVGVSIHIQAGRESGFLRVSVVLPDLRISADFIHIDKVFSIAAWAMKYQHTRPGLSQECGQHATHDDFLLVVLKSNDVYTHITNIDTDAITLQFVGVSIHFYHFPPLSEDEVHPDKVFSNDVLRKVIRLKRTRFDT